MVCEVEQILEDGEWAALEWRDPPGLRGCGFSIGVRPGGWKCCSGVLRLARVAGAIVVGVAVIVERGAKQKVIDAGYKYYAAYSLQDLGL